MLIDVYSIKSGMLGVKEDIFESCKLRTLLNKIVVGLKRFFLYCLLEIVMKRFKMITKAIYEVLNIVLSLIYAIHFFFRHFRIFLFFLKIWHNSKPDVNNNNRESYWEV